MRAPSVLLATLLAFSAGCEGFLEPEVVSFSSTENYYQTPAHMERAVVGVYNRLQATVGSRDYRYMTELRAENATFQNDVGNDPNMRAIDELTDNSDQALVLALWNNVYSTIGQANVVLNRIEGVTFTDQVQKDRIIGEAKFMRALSYWLAVQFWGIGDSYDANAAGVPLVLKETTALSEAYPEGRGTVGEVIAQIIADLEDAKAKLPVSYAGPNVGRATRGAATFLLGRTYLLARDYPKALAAFEEIGAQPYNYSLRTNYRDVFNPGQKNNSESVFEIQYTVASDGQFLDLVPAMAPRNSPPGPVAGDPSTVVVYNAVPLGEFMPTQPFVEGYEATDARKTASIGFYCAAGNAVYVEVNMKIGQQDCIPYFTKWRWPEHMPRAGRDNNNWIMFRYADVLFSRAEALIRLNRVAEGVGFINQVRARAGLAPLGPLSQSAALDALLRERAYELVGEGHRWFDLKRFGKAIEIMSAHGAERRARVPRIAAASGAYRLAENPWRLLYPIPPRTIELSGGTVEQNPGWASN